MLLLCPFGLIDQACGGFIVDSMVLSFGYRDTCDNLAEVKLMVWVVLHLIQEQTTDCNNFSHCYDVAGVAGIM